MTDSDDYFTDDLVLDDDALAILDAVEQKFSLPQSQHPRQRPDDPSPSKRQRTEQGWKTNRSRSRVEQWDELEDLPEVSVRDDGTYTIATQRVSSSSYHPKSHASSPAPTSRPSSARPQDEMEVLHRQLAELRRENESIQRNLRDAVEAKLAKEGEVGVLRRGMEKTAQDHAAHVAKLAAAKEDADARRAQIQKEMKEEMERLRTQFMFKQHELETSSRRIQWSAQTSRIAADSPVQSKTHEPGPAKKPATLPGFQDAFAASPVRPPRFVVKEEEPNQIEQEFTGGEMDPLTPHLTASIPAASPRSSPSQMQNQPADTMMLDFLLDGENPFVQHTEDRLEDDLDPPTTDRSDGFQPLNLQDEFPRIVLTHRMSPLASITFQKLIEISSSSVTGQLPPEDRPSVPSLLEALANTTSQFDHATRTVAAFFIHTMTVLNERSLIELLSSLLDLMTTLAYAFSSFSAALLSHVSPAISNEQTPLPHIFAVLCSVAKDQLLPPDDTSRDPTADATLLAEKTVGLLECLCWNVPEELQNHLSALPRNALLMSILLHQSQPPWLLYRSCRLLMFLSTYSKLFFALLSPLRPEKDADPRKDLKPVPHIERLCSFLVDASRQGKDADSMRAAILTFIAMTSCSHTDALAMLLQSQIVVPSLVLYITQLTTLFWEGDESLSTSPSHIPFLVQTLSQALLVLHHLIFSVQPAFNLQHALEMAALHRRFNGVAHMFIVTMGRLSYSDLPKWVRGDVQVDLDQVAEMARDLLDLVVEGPESDSIWTAFQESVEGNVGEDEEMVDL